jgi:spore coat polysaccharide biosynthesis protein SpsF
LSVVGVIQARMGSTRLPGKVLKPLAGEPLLAHVIRRVRAIGAIDVVSVATTTLTEDDPIAQEAEQRGATVIRGDERDVLSRYLSAARTLDASTVMRITCDCPLLDAAVCTAVLELLNRKSADYASNVATATWPHGLDCEVFTRDALERAAQEAVADDEREHVTLWMRRNETLRHVELEGPGGEIARQRWVVDYPEDYEFLQNLVRKLPPPPALPGWRDVVATLRSHPEIAAINRDRVMESSARAGVVARSQ